MIPMMEGNTRGEQATPDLNLTAYGGQQYQQTMAGSQISPSSGSSYTVLTNHTGSPSPTNGSFVNVLSPGTNVSSLTDVTLEQAMGKIQELSQENAGLREFLKENNGNVKKQFHMLLQWKEKVRETNKTNLRKFEEYNQQINHLKHENERYRQALQAPDQQGSLTEQLQKHIKQLEEEKLSTCQEASILKEKVEELKSQLVSKCPEKDIVFVQADENVETYKNQCQELALQVQNFHQQNEQLMQDLQQVNNLKQSIQVENSKLSQENIELQKKLQAMLGDKAKHSVGAVGTGKPELAKTYDYSVVEHKESDAGSSVAQQDLDILEMQTAARTESLTEQQESGLLLSELNDQLKEKLELVSSTNNQQKQQLTSQEVEISRLQTQLAEKDQMLSHYKECQEAQIAEVTQQHERQQQDLLRQLDGLNYELQQTKSSLPYRGDVQNLKSQVMSLIKEVQETNAKLELASKALENKSQRIVELEQETRRIQQTRHDDGTLTKNLKYSLSMCEETISRERQEHATTKRQMTELRSSFNQLVNDYKELLDTFDEYKEQQVAQQAGNQNKQVCEEINRLTAQTIAAEEAITYRDDQIKKLQHEISKLKDELDNTVPVLRAQADVWKQDFDAERNARERQVQEKDAILQEMKNLEQKNQQLIDELESYSRKSLAEMQRRHAPAMPYQQQIRSHLQGGNQGHNYPPQQPSNPGYPRQQSQAGYHPQQHSPQAGYHHGGRNPYQPQEPVEHGGVEYGQPGERSPSRMSNNSQQDDDNQMQCPKCNLSCPDLDTLQIHVLDCIDN